MNNLFSYSPKELTTDGFLTWIIYEISGNKKDLVGFFKRLGLCNESAVEISKIDISRQEENTDLILRYEIDSVPYQALFENKTYSTIDSNQLCKYKNKFPDLNYYKYLKLARINYYEKKEAKANGYDVLSSFDLYEALDSLTLDSEILTQYKKFLIDSFVAPLNEIEHEMLSGNKFELFRKRQAQQYFIDILYQEIDELNDSIYFKSRSNVGGVHGHNWIYLTRSKYTVRKLSICFGESIKNQVNITYD